MDNLCLDERNVYPLFKSLDRLEDILSKSNYLVGNRLTEADIRLWTTIVRWVGKALDCWEMKALIVDDRFDPVYHGHFKCNAKSIEKDYPNILKWARRIYQIPGGEWLFHVVFSHNDAYDLFYPQWVARWTWITSNAIITCHTARSIQRR